MMSNETTTDATGVSEESSMDVSMKSTGAMSPEDQQAIVSSVATLMGGESSAVVEGKGGQLLRYFASSLPEDAIVCTSPTLTMKVADGGDNPLPAVGQHMETVKSKTAKGAQLQPIMEASVLGHPTSQEQQVGSAPKAVDGLCATESWTKSSVINAPSSMIKNVSDSFSSLVDSRVRSWTLVLFKKSLSSGDNSSRSNLLKMLSANIKVTYAKTNFKTLPFPGDEQPKEADVILPLLFDVSLSISIQDHVEHVKLMSPGTISANFSASDPKALEKVDIRLDSGTLLKAMVDQVRLTVFKVVAKVTATDVNKAVPQPASAAKPEVASLPVANLSGGFSSSLRLTPDQASNSPMLAKARHSALKLNSVLQGSGAKKSESGMKKQRSVQFEHPMEFASIKSAVPPSPKKAKIAETANRLKSFKSFGRPHADDTAAGGPRNATFGNFGRQPIWGRDGKLANHPMPMNSVNRNPQDLMGGKVTGSVNATFGAPQTSAASRLLAQGSNSNNNMNRLPSTLPRTATALEGWLMNAASGNR